MNYFSAFLTARTLGCLLLVPWWFLLGVTSPPLEARDFSRASPILTFAGLPWGSSPSAIMEVHGKPFRQKFSSEPVWGTGRLMEYRKVTLADYPAHRLFYVHARKGLLRGEIRLEIPDRESCTGVFRDVFQQLSNLFSGLEPLEHRMNPTQRPFCESLEWGAGWWVIWYDAHTGTSVVQSLDREPDRITIDYRTRKWGTWVKQIERAREYHRSLDKSDTRVTRKQVF